MTPSVIHNGGSAEMTPRRLVVITAGTSEPSSTRMLEDRIAQRSLELLQEMEPSRAAPSVRVVELAPLAVDIARATVTGLSSEGLQAAVEAIARADAIVASTPVYEAGISGLFKSFVDLLDNDLLVAKPVLLAATAGSSRHALVVDDQMRPLFAYMRALTLPTSVFAAPRTGAPQSSASASGAPRPSSPSSSTRRPSSGSPIAPGPATNISSPATPPAPNSRPLTSTSTHR